MAGITFTTGATFKIMADVDNMVPPDSVSCFICLRTCLLSPYSLLQSCWNWQSPLRWTISWCGSDTVSDGFLAHLSMKAFVQWRVLRVAKSTQKGDWGLNEKRIWVFRSLEFLIVWTDASWIISYLGKCYLLYISCFFLSSSFCSLLRIGCEKIVWNKANELKCCWLGRIHLSPFCGQCL